MPIVEVSNLHVTRSKVEIPTVCTGRRGYGTRAAHDCGADLTEPDALTVWEYSDQARGGRLAPPYEFEGDDPDGGVILDDEIATGGDSFIPAVAIYCAHCGAPLAEGTMAIENETD